jgi:hypothetical protein
VSISTARFSGPLRWFYSLVNEHPDANTRIMALAEREAIFRVDLVTLVIQGFFAATVVETVLQLLLVGASVDISSLVERQVHLRAQLTRYPEIILGIVGVAALACSVTNFLVIRRVSMSQRPTGHTLEVFAQTALLYALGSLIALISSQTFLWEISNANWSVTAWFSQDTERPVIYIAGVLGFVLGGLIAKFLLAKGGSPILTAISVCILPSLLQLSAATWFLLPAPLE